ncbi:cytochrome b/b6 domain-containing protein [Dehalococcoidales bacterium]|nr:cytochrome b/b6 domain-containing protein [Dehalococcoidales bacterium]
MKEEIHHPAIARFLHWTWALAILLLGLSGLYIHEPNWMPLFGAIGGMTAARLVHFICMWVVMCLVAYRIYYSLASGDYKDLLLRVRDFWGLPRVAAHYLCLMKPKPAWGKYNPGQRITYNFWLLLIIIQIFTGLALYHHLDWVTVLLGGCDSSTSLCLGSLSSP